MKRIVVYARISTQDQALQNQLSQLREYASSQGWKIVSERVDVASGSKGTSDRQGLDEVFLLAHQKRFDVLLFWSLDRLSREGSRKTIEYLTRLEQNGIGWHSFTEPYLSSLGVFGDAIIALLSALARQERLRIGERTKAGLERARANGKRCGRPPTGQIRSGEAMRLRKSGLSLSQIGDEMKLCRSRVHQLLSIP